MSDDKVEVIGKQVKDMYGSPMGRAIGTITDIDGTIQTVGIDCGSCGLEQVPYAQLVVQDDVVVFIPKWRLDSQKLLREKRLTLNRLRALMDIVSTNDEMKDDAQIIREKYHSKLVSLSETEKEIQSKLETRLEELDGQMKAVKMLVFDAKVQYKSKEISEATYEAARRETTGMMEHIRHETAEISNVQTRITDIEADVREMLEPQKQPLQESAVSYLDAEPSAGTQLPEAPACEEPQHEKQPEIAEPPRADWLSRMQAEQ